MKARKLSKMIILAGAMAIPMQALAGPFGIDFENDTPESLGCERFLSVAVFECINVPTPIDGVESYIGTYSKRFGICDVMAIADPLRKGLYEIYLDALAEKYGEPSLKDGFRNAWVNAGGAGFNIELFKDEESLTISYFISDWEKVKRCQEDAERGPDLKEAL